MGNAWSGPLWAVAIALSAAACAIAAPRTTPIDRALPVVGAALAAAAAVVRQTRWWPGLLAAVPLLVACAAVLGNEEARLLAYGGVVAAAICGALLAAEPLTLGRAAALTVISVGLLRWLGRTRFEIGREAVICLGAVAIVAVMPRRSTLSVAIAVLAALVSPAIPAETMLIPLAVAILASLVRVRLTFAPLLVLALALMLFAWSGMVAREPVFFVNRVEARPRVPLGWALAPAQSVVVEPAAAEKSLVVSVANGLQLQRGTVVGMIDGRPIRMGEVADWGALRREVWWRARVHSPKRPAGSLAGYGYDAWAAGAARIPLTPGAHRVTADPHLPKDARLQLDGFEW